MRFFPLFLLSALAGLAQQPRLSIIGPSEGTLLGAFQTVDLDGDGDLDVASLPQSRVSNDSRTWFENRGNNQLSRLRAFGLRSNRNHPLIGRERFIEIGDDAAPEILSVRQTVLSRGQETYELSLIHPFVDGRIAGERLITTLTRTVPHVAHLSSSLSPELLFSSRAADGQLQIHFKTIGSQGELTDWSPQILNLPDEGNSFDSLGLSGLVAIDLDGDGDRDLALGSNQKTFIFERLSERQFSTTPTIFEGRFDEVLDLDNDGTPELLDNKFGEIRFLKQRSPDSFSFELFSVLDSSGGRLLYDESSSPARSLVGISSGSGRSLELKEYVLAGDSLIQSFAQVLNFDFVPRRDVRHLSYLGDLDGDMHQEVIVITTIDTPIESPIEADSFRVGKETKVVSVYQRGASGYELVAQSPTSPAAIITELAHGDFDQDDDIDLIFGPTPEGLFQLLTNDGDGNFSEPSSLNLHPDSLDPEAYFINDLRAIDFDQDGILDLAFSLTPRTYGFGPRPIACTIVSGLGNGQFSSVELPPGSFRTVSQGYCSFREFIDWDRDGDLDVISDGGWLENIEGKLSPNFRPLIGRATTEDAIGNPFEIGKSSTGDIDGDGHPDFIMSISEILPKARNPFTGEIIDPFGVPESNLAIAFNDGQGGIAKIASYPGNLFTINFLGDPVALDLSVLDLDLDGRDELILPERAMDVFGNPILLRSQRLLIDSATPRDLNSGFIQIITEVDFPQTRQLADYDGDGSPEYVDRHFFVKPTTLGPVFSPKFNFSGALGPRPPKTLALADFDGDEDLDAIVASTHPDALVLVRNLIIDERSEIRDELLALGVPNALTSPLADADSDGVTNQIEYLLGSDPLVPGTDGAIELLPKWTDDNRNLSFLCRVDRSDLSLFYDLEASTDLVNWSRVSQQNAFETPVNEQWEIVTVPVDFGSSRSYYRVSASHDPSR